MHASRLQASAKPDDDEMTKEIYHTMRRAASYFDCVHGSQLDRFTFKQIPGSAFTTDLDARIVQCMAEQCLAEAQEVTLNRARLKGHTAAIMAGIALDERDRFRAAKKHILQMVCAENHRFRPPHRSRPILPLVTRGPSMRRCHIRKRGLGGWRVRGLTSDRIMLLLLGPIYQRQHFCMGAPFAEPVPPPKLWADWYI